MADFMVVLLDGDSVFLVSSVLRMTATSSEETWTMGKAETLSKKQERKWRDFCVNLPN